MIPRHRQSTVKARRARGRACAGAGARLRLGAARLGDSG